jgi:hypothetical protein
VVTSEESSRRCRCRAVLDSWKRWSVMPQSPLIRGFSQSKRQGVGVVCGAGGGPSAMTIDFSQPRTTTVAYGRNLGQLADKDSGPIPSRPSPRDLSAVIAKSNDGGENCPDDRGCQHHYDLRKFLMNRARCTLTPYRHWHRLPHLWADHDLRAAQHFCTLPAIAHDGGEPTRCGSARAGHGPGRSRRWCRDRCGVRREAKSAHRGDHTRRRRRAEAAGASRRTPEGADRLPPSLEERCL